MQKRLPVFKMRADVPESDVIMPHDELNARTSPRTIGELISRLEEFTKDEDKARRESPWADRFVMGYPLANWQRPVVWEVPAQIKFIESIWNGSDLGSYMINDAWELVNQNAKNGDAIEMVEHSEIILDGQQRLTAIQNYLLNAFPVNDNQGNPRYFSELGIVERRRFAGITFSRASINSFDEQLLRKAYNLRSFGGVAHKESERA